MSRMNAAVAAVLTCGLLVAPALADEINPSGQWEITTGESRYRIAPCGDSGEELCAKLVWLRDDARTAENLELLNKTIVRGAPVDENKWAGTFKYEGQVYEATVTVTSPNALRVHSCSGIFCQSFELNRL